jgi:pimeloyl-ACP methyl ester carboxylesterase
MRLLPSVLLILCASGSSATADTIILKSGRKITDVVVSRNDEAFVVYNPWNSRHAKMTWEVPEKNKIEADKVEEVIIEESPEVEYLTRVARNDLIAEEHFELAMFCDEHKMKDERQHHLAMTLRLAPDHAEALEMFSASKYASFLRKSPSYDPAIHELERAYIESSDPAELEARWKAAKGGGSKLSLSYLERARSSAGIQKGRRDAVPLSIGADEAPGATYAIHVSKKYDPLQPTPLVIGLHGGGAGGKDDTLVTGSGESALNFYQQEAEQWGWIVACPSALKAPWRSQANAPVIDSLIEEMKILYNIDERRIYLVGHSMGGFGTWHWGPARSEVWAACAPCAGGGGPNGIQIPVYIYHGTDDPICRVGRDRSAAKALVKAKKKSKPREQFVYTELDGVGHGFPDSVRSAIFKWFAGIRKDKWKGAKYLDSSFERKPTKEEIAIFGDPRKIPDAGDKGPSIKALAEVIKGGGGAGAEAAEQLGEVKTEEAAKAAAAIVKSRKVPFDAKVLAAQALGDIGLPECVKFLKPAVQSDDYRIIDAATEALGKIGTEDAAASLSRCGKSMGEFFANSFFGDTITHTEYEVRLESFGLLVDALAKTDAKESAFSLFEREIVDRVFDPKKMYKVHGDEDDRFRGASKRARLKLVQRLAACLIEFDDPAGIPLLERIEGRWEKEPYLVDEIGRAIDQLDA